MTRALVTLAVMALAACGGGEVGTDESTPTTAPVATAAPTTEATPETTTTLAPDTTTTTVADSTTTTAGSSGAGGGYDYDFGASGGDSTATTQPAETSAEGAAITIAAFSFGTPVTVTAGEPIEITNNDGVPHTVTNVDDQFDSGSVSPGGTSTLTIDEPGEYAIFCKIHPTMEGSITVEG